AARSGSVSATRPTTVPVASCVSVATPSRSTARLALSACMRYSAIRVALPKHNTSTPVAAGSSVPVWPTLGIPSSVRARATTSWDVHPAGLLMTSTPSKVTPDRRSVRSSFMTVFLSLGRLGPHLIQQGHHPLHPIERGILEEPQRRDVPQLQAPPQLAPDEALGPCQHRQRLHLLRTLL